MKSDKLLIIFFTICIVILLGYFIKRKNGYKKNHKYNKNNNLIFEKRSKRSGWKEPTDAAFSYNHLGEIIHSAVDKETLRDQIKSQELSVLWLRNKLETFCATRCIMNTTLKKRDCKLPH